MAARFEAAIFRFMQLELNCFSGEMKTVRISSRELLLTPKGCYDYSNSVKPTSKIPKG